MSLHNCRVVLVRPRIAANLGATARVMRNWGLSQLVLVAPEADPADREARRLSTHGEQILNDARIVQSWEVAVGDCLLVVATSARIGGPVRRQSVVRVEEVMPHVMAILPKGPVALVFGPEATGLTDAEVTRCHYLVNIPTAPEYPALNLAQAVGICLYELRCAWLEQTDKPVDAPGLATFADQERMLAHLHIALEEIHFLYGEKADALMHALRHLLTRARPSAMEVKLLFGLARQIRWYVAQHPRTEDSGMPSRDPLHSGNHDANSTGRAAPEAGGQPPAAG